MLEIGKHLSREEKRTIQQRQGFCAAFAVAAALVALGAVAGRLFG